MVRSVRATAYTPWVLSFKVDYAARMVLAEYTTSRGLLLSNVGTNTGTSYRRDTQFRSKFRAWIIAFLRRWLGHLSRAHAVE